MAIDRTNPRNPAHEVDAMFVDRWSPRSILAEPLADDQVRQIFEAARWAPSCANEQPWRFWVARTPESRDRFASTLVERNRLWAGKAAVLLYIGARKNFEKAGTPNRHAPFDAGAAWMSLALQARRLGLYAHGMAGFDLEKAYALTGAKPDEVDLIAAVAIGKRGPAESLPEEVRKRESPTARKETERFVVEL